MKIEERVQKWKVLIEEGIRKWDGVTDEMEEQMRELDMKQWITTKTEYCEPVDGVSTLEYKQGMGTWYNNKYEAIVMTNREPYKMIIRTAPTEMIDDGKPYTWDTGIERLKELLKQQ